MGNDPALDWRMRGKLHRAYLIGGATVVAVQVLRIPIAGSDAWIGAAAFLASLGG